MPTELSRVLSTEIKDEKKVKIKNIRRKEGSSCNKGRKVE
jgi:hypothetical protein